MIKILLIAWLRIKSIASTCLSLADLISFFNKVWSAREWILVGTILIWVPLLKIASLCYTRFNIKFPFGLPGKHAKLLMRAMYWLVVVATGCNLVDKYQAGMATMKLVALTLANFLVLLVDFRENEDAIKRIEKERSEKDQ